MDVTRTIMGIFQALPGPEVEGWLDTPSHVGAEQTIQNLVLWLKLGVETLGALIIGVGIMAAAYSFLRTQVAHRPQSYNRIRLTFARFLALALEFQLAADILSTAVAPTWDEIGQLAAIAVIRTTLNYFLAREMKEEQAGIGGDMPPDRHNAQRATIEQHANENANGKGID